MNLVARCSHVRNDLGTHLTGHRDRRAPRLPRCSARVPRLTVTLYLIRHASAGRRNHTAPNDLDRPLDDTGRAQADAFAAWVQTNDISIDAVVSSAALRCQQTVAPLAHKLGLDVETRPGLLEGASTAASIDLVRNLVDRNVVACSHGDIIPDIVRVLEMSGMRVDGERLWHKGATWIIETEDSAFVHATAIDPTTDRS